MQAGTQQDQRFAEALAAGYVLPDEFTLAQRIRLILELSVRLRFAPGEVGRGGRWGEALVRDESVLLADIASFPLERLQSAFFAAWPWAGERYLWADVCRLLGRYDLWCRWLARHDTPPAAQVREALLESVGPGLLASLHTAVRWFGPGGESGLRHPVWRLSPAAGRQGEPSGTAEERLEVLRRLWSAMHRAIAGLRPLAQAQLPASLGGGGHEPAIGLLLTALQLYQDTRAALNLFPERLTEFYYRDLLRMRQRAPARERVHLCLERDPRHRGPVSVAAGTGFLGGRDAQGRAIEFRADGPLEITDSAVTALHSICLERNRLISPEREYDYATAVRAQAIPVLEPQASYEEHPPWWPLLGGQAKGSAARTQDATLGLAIASGVLALAEGERCVRVRLYLAHPVDQDTCLRELMQQPKAQRNDKWLDAVFECLARHEAQSCPARARPVPAADDELAQSTREAWARALRRTDGVWLPYLWARCLAATDADVFRSRLGRLFAVWLTIGGEDLPVEDVKELREKARGLLGASSSRVDLDDPLILIYPPGERPGRAPDHDFPDRTLIFESVFRGLWRAELSVADGWLEVEQVSIRRAEEGGLGGCLEVIAHLGREQPPIVACRPQVHGTAWPAQPLLRLVLQTRTRVYAYSLLQQLVLRNIAITVDVSAAHELVVYNQLGRLDVTKPFMPFGPLPALGAYCVFGSEELATKPLRSLRLRVRWGQLPSGAGGFAERYRGYPGQWGTDSFAVRSAVLSDGQWRESGAGALRLFRGERRPQPEASVDFPESDLGLYVRPLEHAPQPFELLPGTRSGFFRLQLCAPQAAFGHAEYPRLLSEALTLNARLKKAKLSVPLPQQPYTPVIEQVSVDYTATDVLTLQGADARHCGGRLFHLYPFGQDAAVSSAGGTATLLPRFAHDGNLYVGLSGSRPQGALSLFFLLRAQSAEEWSRESRPRLSWAVWCAEGWRTLDRNRLFSDGTLGFLRTGIVVLDLPEGMSRECPRLPDGVYWLRLSADWGLERLAGLYGVYTQALGASRVAADAADSKPLPPGSVRQPLRAIAGLRAVRQIGPSFGLRPLEARDMFRARSAERLRHKNRASSPWDYERLLLDAFPEVFKVRCFAGGHAGGSANRSGLAVLVVVVRAPQLGTLFYGTQTPHFNAAALEQMSAYLSARARPDVQVVVRNATFERIQVRCALRLVRGTHPGEALARINGAIVEFLSPWHRDGCRPEFQWEVRAETLETRLRELEDVDALGGLSLLHIVRRGPDRYRLSDTGRPERAARAGAGLEQRRVRAARPWSLALPTRRHLVEVMEAPAPAAQPTGIGRLEIGDTLIVDRERGPRERRTP